MATFEPMEATRQMSFRIGYVILGVCLTLTSLRLLIHQPLPRTQADDSVAPSREPVSTVLLFVGVIGLAIGLMPNGKKYTDSATSERVTQWRIGPEFSPIYEYTKRETDGGMKFESGLNILSWSLVPILIGSTCLELRRRKINSKPTPNM
ncbi:MAG: hypothetical protein GY903_02935 [Fuerstiella sp.]|nr:hypothetical protein [Fuerstiella sp.]MCP4853433.1 hypothetical protein [Fuerstiella sp.]